MDPMTDVETALRAAARNSRERPPRAVELSLLGRADAAGVVDVAYAVVDGPTGPLVVAATEAGLVRVSFDDVAVAAEELARRISPRVLAAPRRLDDVRRQLDEYFAGRRRAFDTPLDWRLVTGPFARQVLETTARIPYGATSTYTDIAQRAGNARASRAAGNALGANPLCVIVPCHRVVRAGGGLGGYAGGLAMKRALLALEAAAS